MKSSFSSCKSEMSKLTFFFFPADLKWINEEFIHLKQI